MPDTGGKVKLWLALPTAIGVGILNVLCFFLFMVIYSYAIDPGHEEVYYSEAASRFGPTSSIICGIPLMYLAGRWIGKRVGPALAIIAGVLVWTVYAVLDFSIVAGSGVLISVLPLFVISFASKFAAVYLGARQARQATQT
jgi:hypothetical protein